MTKLIGLTGLAGSGKSTAARALVDIGYVEVSLADPLKRICQDLFGWSHDRLWGPSELRNAPDPRWGGLTARHALQTLGTESACAMHPDIWVRRAIAEAQRHDRVVISDVRFDNEAAAIRAAGGLVIRLQRSGVQRVNDHVSEAGVSYELVDWTLRNDGSVHDTAQSLYHAIGWAP